MQRSRKKIHYVSVLAGFWAVLWSGGESLAGIQAPLDQAPLNQTACLGGGQGEVVGISPDGRDGSLVWLTDASADLWLCHTDAHGHMTFSVPILADLLKGAGLGLLKRRSGSSSQPAPAMIAAAACKIYAEDETAEILAAVPDGLEGAWLSGYAITLKTAANETVLCNATPNAQIWVYRPLKL